MRVSKDGGLPGRARGHPSRRPPTGRPPQDEGLISSHIRRVGVSSPESGAQLAVPLGTGAPVDGTRKKSSNPATSFASGRGGFE